MRPFLRGTGNAGSTAPDALPIAGTIVSWQPPTFSVWVVCPDLLRLQNIGEADTWRGRVVRAFFWLMRLWPPKP